MLVINENEDFVLLIKAMRNISLHGIFCIVVDLPWRQNFVNVDCWLKLYWYWVILHLRAPIHVGLSKSPLDDPGGSRLGPVAVGDYTL